MCQTNSIIPTSVGVHTLSTIVLLALITNCAGGALLTTQGTHLYLILRGGRVAFIGPNMRRDMVPWSIKSTADLPPNAKLHEMQHNMHGLVHLSTAAMLDDESMSPISKGNSMSGL